MKMKRIGLALVMLAGMFGMCTALAPAASAEGILEGTPVKVSSDVAIYSKYMWRGFKLDDDPVIQPGLYVSAYGFTASLWTSFDFDADDALNSDEVDYCIDYTYDFEKISLSVGHTYYDFPAADAASKEFYVGGSVDVLLAPSLTWFHDYGEEDSGGGDGDYVLLSIGHSFDMGESPITLDLGASVGYNSELFIEGEGGDVGLTTGLTIPLTDNCSFSPSIGYMMPFGDMEDANDGNQDNEFYGGAVIAFTM